MLDPVEDAFNDIAGSVDAWATFAGMLAQAPFLMASSPSQSAAWPPQQYLLSCDSKCGISTYGDRDPHRLMQTIPASLSDGTIHVVSYIAIAAASFDGQVIGIDTNLPAATDCKSGGTVSRRSTPRTPWRIRSSLRSTRGTVWSRNVAPSPLCRQPSCSSGAAAQ